MKVTRKQRNAVNQNRDNTTADAEIEKFLQLYREGKVRGAVISFTDEDGKMKHKLMGSLAEDISAAMNQVRRLDLAVSRRFFSS
ncbi:hypothetical protein E5S69_20585 [Cupriavidus necator]|nr:hypothetical protein [Cupriavidus necator]